MLAVYWTIAEQPHVPDVPDHTGGWGTRQTSPTVKP